jgi:hypothetical protein
MRGFASDRDSLTSVDLLAGLLFDHDSRAQTLFGLREYFPIYEGRPWKYATLPERKRAPVFDKEMSKILAQTIREANHMGDYWMDTEHLLLGILRVPGCLAAQYLSRVGLGLEATRESIQQNRSSRPDYGPVPRWWALQGRLGKLTWSGRE